MEGSRSKYRNAISSQLKGEELEGAPEPIIPANIDIDNLDILDIAPEEIARQMTLLDFDLFARIDMREWFDAQKNNPILTPNINAFIKRFNEVRKDKKLKNEISTHVHHGLTNSFSFLR